MALPYDIRDQVRRYGSLFGYDMAGFTIAAAKTFEFQTFPSNVNSTPSALSFGVNEIYSTITIEKLA